MDFALNVIQTIFIFLDQMVYGAAKLTYGLLIDIANGTVFSQEVIQQFGERIYALLGIFMLFKVTFSMINYIVNPDDFSDKQKGTSKLIVNILTTLVLIVLTPRIFQEALDLQRLIISENVLGRVVLGDTGSVDKTANKDAYGDSLAMRLFGSFFYFEDVSQLSGKNVVTAISTDNNYIIYDSYDSAFSSKGGNYTALKAIWDDVNITYWAILSTAAGVILFLVLIQFCFDVAIRTVKLGFLQIISPIPIISRIDPKSSKDGPFGKWVKQCTKTYLDLFVRLIALYFAIYAISVFKLSDISSSGNVLAGAMIILGILLFAKQLPKLLEDLLGIKLDGGFTLNPVKRLSSVPGMGVFGGAVGGAVGASAANVYAGIRNKSGFGATAKSAAGGFFGGGFRGARAGVQGKGKDNFFKAAGVGIKDAVDARELRVDRIEAGDGKLSGTIRRYGVAVDKFAGVASGLEKFNKQISVYDDFLKEQANLDSYVEGEINKGKYTQKFDFDWKDINGNKQTEPNANIYELKNKIETLKNSHASETDIANAELAYGSALKVAKMNYIDDHAKGSANEEVAVVAALDNMDYIRKTHTTIEEFAKMGDIVDGFTWDDSKKTIKQAKTKLTSSTEYRQALINKQNDAKSNSKK